MDNEHPAWKTSASGHAKCRSSRLGGGYRMGLSKCIGKRGGCSASLGHSLLKKKIYNLRPYGDNLFLECHGFLSEMNQCQKHRKQGNICRGMCTPLAVGGLGGWGGQSAPWCSLFTHSSSALAIPRLATLPRINLENTSIYHDKGSPRMNYDRILSTSVNKTDPDVIQF